MDGGGGGGGPAPFLLKTYEMVDDSATDDIVSWSPSRKSFVVWNPPDFAARLLPTYFKHNNFSSFIRQLNTYGFRKIDPERWEFANDGFVKGQKHLLKNIYRRKPIHSHSNPPAGGLSVVERKALEEEIERLNREKTSLQASLWKFKQQQSGTKIQLDDLDRRLADMEQRQLKMVAFMQRAMKNPRIMENLLKMANASSVDFSLAHKKRRLPPGVDYSQEVSENSFYDDSSISKPEMGQVLDQEFCDKLKLELRSAMPDSNLVADSTQNSNEDTEGSEGRHTSHVMMERLPLVPETLELCDTGASICPTKSLLFPAEVDEGDALFPCQLSLTLASSAMQIDRSEYSSRATNSVDLGAANVIELRTGNTSRENDHSVLVGKESAASPSPDAKGICSKEASSANDEIPSVPPGRVNDLFWEQFLTERPGSTEAEESSSGISTNTCDEQIQETENRSIWRTKNDMQQLKL